MGQTASAHVTGVGPQLIRAAKAGDADAVAELVSYDPQLLRYSTFRQLAPCHYAARDDHVDVLQVLIAKAEELEHQLKQQAQHAAASAAGGGGDVASRVGSSSRRQLRPAAGGASAGGHPRQHQHHEQQAAPRGLVWQLVNASSDRGITPLMLAVNGGCVASVRLLLAKGACPWVIDKLGGRTALHYCARSNNVDIMQLLIDAAGVAGPLQFPNRPNTKYVDVRTQTGFTAIHFAVQADSRAALAVLLSNGANPLLSSLFDSMDTINCVRGATALHLAARYGNEAVAHQLLKAYMEQWYHRHLPDPRLLMDGDSQLPCQIAARREHRAVARTLLPSTPLASLFADGELELRGPPSLAAIAGGVLRDTLARDLQQAQQLEETAEQEQHEQEQAEETEQEACASDDADACTAAADKAALDSRVERHGCCKPGRDEAAAAAGAPGGNGNGKATAARPAAAASASPPPPPASEASDVACGVCLDGLPQVALSPCGHELCIDCCQHLLALNSRCVMVCPFCRASVAHLRPLLSGDVLVAQQQQGLTEPAAVAPLVV